MGRIMSFDYGSKRTGIAITDPQKIICSPYKTCSSYELIDFIKEFIIKNEIDEFVVGMPLSLKNKSTNSTPLVNKFIFLLKKNFPSIPVQIYDERYTSKIAKKAYTENITLKEAAIKHKIITSKKFDQIVKPKKMI